MTAMKKTGNDFNGNSRQVNFRGREKDSSTRQYPERLTSDGSGDSRISSASFPSLTQNLMRTNKKRDPFQYYEVSKMLGDGSMGSVCMVQKRKSALGGSARKGFVNRQRTSNLAKILPCLSFCLPGESSEETKGGALVATADEDGEEYHIQKTETSRYGILYALKSIILDHVKNDTFIRELQNEIAILRTLDHPNICKAIETYEFKKQMYLVLELCSGGDLYCRDPYNELQARHIVHSVLDACAFLHKRNITHRDRESNTALCCLLWVQRIFCA